MVNTMGCGLLGSYGTMAAVSLKPFMCYKHPNGQESMVSYPGVFCGEGEHGSMLILAWLLLVVFVAGFFALCAYACWNVSTWAATRQVGKVQSFRFSMASFRLDAYWFILPVLLRGFSFALSVVIGSNHPPLQTALASVILTIYGIAVTKMRPWKSPVINYADTVVTACFLLLVSKSIQVSEDEELAFAESYTIVLLLFLGRSSEQRDLQRVVLVYPAAGVFCNSPILVSCTISSTFVTVITPFVLHFFLSA